MALVTSALLFILLISPVAFASPPPPKIVFFFEAPLTFINNEKVRKDIPDIIKKKMESINCTMLDFDECQTSLQTYREDNDMIANQFYPNLLNPNLINSNPLKRQDIQKIAQQLGADYAIFIQVLNNAPRTDIGMFDVDFKTTITCNLRVVNVKTGNYVLNKSIVKDGKSGAGLFSYGSFDKAYNEALKKALDEIEFTNEMFSK